MPSPPELTDPPLLMQLQAANRPPREGLRFARLMLVISSMSPLFLIWSIRGAGPLIPDSLFLTICALAIIVPNAFLAARIYVAIRDRDRRQFVIGHAQDSRDHLIVYLLAVLLAFSAPDFSNWRSTASALAAMVLVIYVFWYLDLHYANVLFAIAGYRVFVFYPPNDGNRFSGRGSRILITKRVILKEGDKIIAYRLSDTVYLECGQNGTLL